MTSIMDEWTLTMQLLDELAAAIERVQTPDNKEQILNRIMAANVPDELQELIVRPKVTVGGVIDTHLVFYAKQSSTAPDIKGTLLKPFESQQKLLAIATDFFYKANVFSARYIIKHLPGGNGSFQFLSDLRERSNARTLTSSWTAA